MYYCLLFMVSLYSFIVFPNAFDYFYFPRYISLTIVSLITAYIYFKNVGFLSLKKYPALLIFLSLLIISTVFGLDPMNSWLGSDRYTGLSTYIFCTILFLAAAESRDQVKLLKVAIFSGVIVSIIALLQWFGINPVPHEELRNQMISYSTMANRNFFGSFMVFLLPAAMLFWINEGRRIWLMAVALLFAGLIVSVTRSAWLTFAIIVFLSLIGMIKGKYSKKSIFIMLLTFLMIFLILLPTRDGYIVNRAATIPGEINAGFKSEDGAGAGRMFIWKETLKLVPKYWMLGMGPDNLRYGKIAYSSGTAVDKAHNIYLDMLITMGIFSLIVFIYFLSTVIKIPKNNIEEALFLMIVSYLVQGFFNFEVIMVMPIFWIILGFSYSNRTKRLSVI